MNTDYSEEKFGRQVQLFNHVAKINFQAAYKQINKYATINISICLNNEANLKWESKVTVQVNPEKELSELARCLIKKEKVFEARFHGINKNKGYRILWDDNYETIDVSISFNSNWIYYRLERGEVFLFRALVFEQLQKLSGGLTVTDVVSLLT
jgi:hypothetical protein